MESNAQSHFKTEREKMIQKQIADRGVSDPAVLNAMLTVERHLFVPDNLQSLAYNDEPLPIGCSQTISQPFIVAYMTEALNLKKSDKVLEIGTGSGYQAAVLSEIVNEVYTIEIVKPLALRTMALFQKLHYSNIHCRIGDGYEGWAEYAPLDAIIVTAAPPVVPEKLLLQLADDGRMIIPVGNNVQYLEVFTKKNNVISKKRLIPVRFVPMTGRIRQ